MFAGLSGTEIALFLLSLIIGMAVHEAMHGYVAHWLGDSTAADAGRLTLNPLKHTDLFTTVLLPMVMLLSGLTPFMIAKPVPFNPDRLKYDEYGAALVGIAGPLTNLGLAALAGIVFRVWGAHLGLVAFEAVVIFAKVNIALFIFNMIPFPPLDGSRLLYAFAPEPLQEVMQRIEAFGFFAILAFFFLIFQFISGPIVNIENSVLQFLLG
jgi:Zn-dependent protease